MKRVCTVLKAHVQHITFSLLSLFCPTHARAAVPDLPARHPTGSQLPFGAAVWHGKLSGQECAETSVVCLCMVPGCTTGAKPFPLRLQLPQPRPCPGEGGPGPWALPAVPSRWLRSQTSLSKTDIVITEGLIKSWAKLKHVRSERPLVSAVLK